MSALVWRCMFALAVLSGCQVYDPYLIYGDSGSAGKHAAGSGGRSGTGGASGSAPARAGSGGSDGGAGEAGTSGAAGSGGMPEAGMGDAGAGGSGGAGAGGAAGGSGAGGSGGAGAGGSGGSGGTSSDAGPCMPELEDCCPDDGNKTAPGICGCGVADDDSDGDGTADCSDDAPHGWQHALTIDGTQVSAALTNFPLLVSLSDAQLGMRAASSGEDLYFTAADRKTLLDFEIERYTAASGALVAWVRVPSVAAGSDTQLYLGYGDGKKDRANASGVWSGYHNVWHLAQDPSQGASSIRDATGRAHGTPQGSMAAGARVAAIAGDGLTFDGSDDQIDFTNDISGNGPSTFSGWVKQADDSGDYGSAIVSIGPGNVGQARFLLSRADANKVKTGFYGNDDLTNHVLQTGSWSYLVWTWDGSNSRVYVNGASVLGPAAHASVNTSGTTGRIGNSTFTYTYRLKGDLDEVRIATVELPAAWIAAEYANQRPGSTFLKSIGPAEPAPQH